MNRISDISTLQIIYNLHNFTHVISIQNNEAAITLSGSSSGRIRWQLSIRPHPVLVGFQKFESGTFLDNVYLAYVLVTGFITLEFKVYQNTKLSATIWINVI